MNEHAPKAPERSVASIREEIAELSREINLMVRPGTLSAQREQIEPEAPDEGSEDSAADGNYARLAAEISMKRARMVALEQELERLDSEGRKTA
jgi:hypothetical protein